MGHEGHCHHHRNKQRKKAACVVCILGLILLIILLLILYFSVFKPKDPRVQVPVMQMPLYNAAAGMPPNMTSLNLGLNLQVYIYNPNRGNFYIGGESTASIYYGATQMGVAFLPNNTHISSQSFITISIYVGMQKPILLNMPTIPNNMILPISTVVTIFGHITTAGVFSHQSSVVSVCDLSIALGSSEGYIQSYNCKRSYPIS